MKKFIAITAGALALLLLTGCNRQPIDLTLKYDEAIVALPDGRLIQGKVDSWRDYEDGDQLQVVIDGVTYLAHSTDVVLIAGEAYEGGE